MDEFIGENMEDNEVYFDKPDEFEPLRSLFDSLEKAILDEAMHDNGWKAE